MKVARMFLGAIALMMSVSAHAASWQKVMSCENGAVVIDVDQDERRHLQIVFKGESLLRRLRDAGMISPNFGDTEIAMDGMHAELRQVSETETRPEYLSGVYYPWDLKKIYFNFGEAGAREVEVRGASIAFKKYFIQSGTRCPNWDDLECRGGVYHRTYEFTGEVILGGCQAH